MTLPSAPPPQNDSGRLLRIGFLVVIGVIVLCGLLGTCLFVFSLLAPLVQQ